MMFKYDPTVEVTERKFSPWPAGEYDFEITEATPQISKKAMEEGITEPNMIKLNMKVYNHQGDYRYVRDYVMPSVGFKWKPFCETVGLDDPTVEWQAEDLIQRSGKLKLKIESGTADYPDDKNTVAAYLPGAPKPNNRSTKELLGEDMSDLPF